MILGMNFRNIKHKIEDNLGFLSLILLILTFRSSVYTHNLIPSESMMPVLKNNDIVTVNKLAYELRLPFTNFVLFKFKSPKKGDIVTFKEHSTGKYMIKRVMATSGDEVFYLNGEFIINGEKLKREPVSGLIITKENLLKLSKNASDFKFYREYNSDSSYIIAIADVINIHPLAKKVIARNFRLIVPDDNFFVIGDNRHQSVDSRFFDTIHMSQIQGKAHYLFFNYKLMHNRDMETSIFDKIN